MDTICICDKRPIEGHIAKPIRVRYEIERVVVGQTKWPRLVPLLNELAGRYGENRFLDTHRPAEGVYGEINFMFSYTGKKVLLEQLSRRIHVDRCRRVPFRNMPRSFGSTTIRSLNFMSDTRGFSNVSLHRSHFHMQIVSVSVQ
jgi:hypothetical protein